MISVVPSHSESSIEYRKTWQSLARLKSASTSSGFRPRSLPTGSQSWNSTSLPPSSSSAAAQPSTVNRTAGPLSPTVEEESSNAQVHLALSPIASGSSSLSYAPKSSPSTFCGGTGGGARVGLDEAQSISADQSPFDTDVLAANGISVNFLANVDQRLKLINK